ncbi:MAG: DUF1284 domain-containing protein [Oscillospiraceae bacterium]
MLKLRPHHLLCIQKFTGHGYSTDFTKHMTELVDSLRSSSPVISLVEGCDELCSHCPNNECGKCASLQKVDSMDRAVLALCGLCYGDSAVWPELSAAAREKILDTDGFSAVCGDCQWYKLCKNTKTR